MKMPPQEENFKQRRWTLLRDLGVLQVKLLVDGLRDIILVPASLIAGIVGSLDRPVWCGQEFTGETRTATRIRRSGHRRNCWAH